MTEQQIPDHANYQVGVYLQGLAGNLPELPFTYPEWERQAREELDSRAYGYVAGSAGLERTAEANVRAFDDWQFVPRMMRDVSTRDPRVEIFGQTMPAPVLTAPIGVQTIIHPDGEVASAKAAAETGVTTVQSTAAGKPLEEVAEAIGDAPRWFQLYWPNDRDVAISLVRRAERAGYTAIMVTADTKYLAYRPRDLETAYLPFLHQTGVANWFTDDAFRAGLDESPEDNPQLAVLHWVNLFANRSLTWDDVRWLREQTELPLLVKGIQHPDDATAAVDAGCDGIVVSNHGGRQVDGARASLAALPGCVDAVGPDVPVIFDSGVRSGADVAKAVALGARAVMVGRPMCWGLGLDGQSGVEHVLKCILAEYDLTLSLLGLQRTDELTPDVLDPSGN